jgi:hypothetical protein
MLTPLKNGKCASYACTFLCVCGRERERERERKRERESRDKDWMRKNSKDLNVGWGRGVEELEDRILKCL